MIYIIDYQTVICFTDSRLLSFSKFTAKVLLKFNEFSIYKK